MKKTNEIRINRLIKTRFFLFTPFKYCEVEVWDFTHIDYYLLGKDVLVGERCVS